MEREFIPYELAVKLQDLGFDEPCFGYYLCKRSDCPIELEITTSWIDLMPYDSSSCLAPTYSQVFRWFRERHNIDGLFHKTAEGSYYFWITECEYENYNHYKYYNQMVYFNTYEEAELACLERLIELIESKSE